MNRHVIAILSLFVLWSAAASGATTGGPSTGIWWNPSESGRGFDIDLQGDTMLVTTFIYTNGGDPIWYLSSGTYNHATGTFASTFDSFSGGQCFGCSNSSPDVHSGAAGPVSIVFHTNETATLTFPGGSTNIVKYNYGLSTPLDNLDGEWAMTFDIDGLVGGDWILLANRYTGSDGTVYAAGNLDGATQDVVLATFSSSLNAYIIAVSVGSFTDLFKMGLDDHRGAGAAWVLSGDEQPTGNGSPAFAARLLWKDELIHLNGAKKSRTDEDRSRFVQALNTDAADPELAEVAQRLRNALAEKRASLDP